MEDFKNDQEGLIAQAAEWWMNGGGNDRVEDARGHALFNVLAQLHIEENDERFHGIRIVDLAKKQDFSEIPDFLQEPVAREINDTIKNKGKDNTGW